MCCPLLLMYHHPSSLSHSQCLLTISFSLRHTSVTHPHTYITTEYQSLMSELCESMNRNRFIYLCILKHLLQALLHLLEFTRLDATISQQHAPELSLADSAIHRIVPLELHGGRRDTRWRLSATQRDKQINKGGRIQEMGNSKYWCQASSWIMLGAGVGDIKSACAFFLQCPTGAWLNSSGPWLLLSGQSSRFISAAVSTATRLPSLLPLGTCRPFKMLICSTCNGQLMTKPKQAWSEQGWPYHVTHPWRYCEMRSH